MYLPFGFVLILSINEILHVNTIQANFHRTRKPDIDNNLNNSRARGLNAGL